MTAARQDALLDRALSADLLDLALAVAQDGSPWATKRRLLGVALRDVVSAQESEGKTKKCLTRVWINPPVAAQRSIGWATEAAGGSRDRRFWHVGAVLATYPFVGSVAATIGRALALDGQVDTRLVRRKACEQWGDRSSVDVAARKVYTTFLRLGILQGGGHAALTAGERLTGDGPAAVWLIHALLLTRRAESVDEASLSTAPELFWVDVPAKASGDYPWLAQHREGTHRTVWVDRGRAVQPAELSQFVNGAPPLWPSGAT